LNREVADLNLARSCRVPAPTVHTAKDICAEIAAHSD